jgi:hypothetical protein
VSVSRSDISDSLQALLPRPFTHTMSTGAPSCSDRVKWGFKVKADADLANKPTAQGLIGDAICIEGLS